MGASRRSGSLWWTVPAIWLALGGCGDTGFDPFEANPLTYSVFGYLDAGVDTQFVRVTPVRDSIALGPGPLAATVTLEHKPSGHQTAWKDSLFVFLNALTGTERLGHNFWSPERILPLETYQLTVTRPDGASATAIVTLPDTFPDPDIFASRDPQIAPSAVTVHSVERLADLVVIYSTYFPGTRSVFQHRVSYLATARPSQDGFIALIDTEKDLRLLRTLIGNASAPIIRIEVLVAAAGPGWPDLAEIDEETLALPNVISNIDGGVGFLGGIVSKTVRWPGFEDRLEPDG